MLESTFAYNGLLLNDQSERQLSDGKYYKVISITGLDDADVRDVRQDRSTTDGETTSDTLYGGRTLTLSGELRARTLEDLRTMISNMQEAYGDKQYHDFVYTPWNKETRFIRAKKVQKLDIPEEQTSANYTRTFTVAIRSEESYAYGVAVNDSIFNTIGGAPALRTYSIAGSPNKRPYPKVYVPQAVGAVPTVENLGNAPAWPVTRLYGYLQNPVLTNQLTGERIIFTDLVIQPNSFIEIDHIRGTVKWYGYEDNYSGLDLVNSDFWSIQKGINPLTLTALDHDSSAYFEIIWKNTYLG